MSVCSTIRQATYGIDTSAGLSWRLSEDFWNRFESEALQICEVTVKPTAVPKTQALHTMAGIPVLLDPLMPENTVALVSVYGDVIKVINLEK